MNKYISVRVTFSISQNVSLAKKIATWHVHLYVTKTRILGRFIIATRDACLLWLSLNYNYSYSR